MSGNTHKKAVADITALQTHIKRQDQTILDLRGQIATMKARYDEEIQTLREQRNAYGTRVEELETEKAGRHAVNKENDKLSRQVERMGSLPEDDEEAKLMAFLAAHQIQSLRNPSFQRDCLLLLRAAWEAYHDLSFVERLIAFIEKSWKGGKRPIGVLRIIYETRIKASAGAWAREQDRRRQGLPVDVDDARLLEDANLTPSGDAS